MINSLPVSRTVGAITLAVFGFAAQPMNAAESILFNGSPAYDCYRAALNDPHPNDIDNCTLAIERQQLSVVELAATYSNRGVLYSRFGDIRESMEDHNRAAELAPALANIFVNRANVFTKMRQFESALDDLDRAVSLGGDVAPIAYYNRALLHQSLGNDEAARADAQTAAKLAPETVQYQLLRDSLAP
ncbi:MAG: hypothetical protein NXH85_12975 [Pseudomonadaceae bacterium]|nr:hypothetical protein [Pseudomonadaceae bacterium]